MFAKIRILIQNTGRSTTMPDGTGTLQCGPATDFSLMIGLILLQTGVATVTHHNVGSFLCNWIFLLLYRPVNRLYILTAAKGR